MLLDVRNLKTWFHTRAGASRAVDGVSFHIERGEIFSLVGESGCGKSMTALSIMQLVPKPAGYHPGGRILLNGEDVLALPEYRKRAYRGRDVSMIFQEPMTSLNPVLTIGLQLMEPLKRHRGMTTEEARKEAARWLGEVGLSNPEQRLKEYPFQLSGGMKQRVMIAMAMACEPGLLIADEPTTALDVTIEAQILELMKTLQRKKGTAILLITHDLSVVAEMADRVGVMYAGRIVETASRQTVLSHPAHPYTVRLLQSLPASTGRDKVLQTIEGRVPPATQYPDHCRFAPRCHMAHEHCRNIDPQLLEVEPEHAAACVLYDEKLQGREVDPAELHLKDQPRPRVAVEQQSQPLVEVRGLEVHFPIRKGLLKKAVGYVRAVDGVDMDLYRGETIGLVGESGCGKTTLGKAMLQLVPPTGGQVRYEGVALNELSRHELLPYRRGLQIIFQDPYSALNPRMLVGETVMEGMAVHNIGDSREARAAKARELLERVGLDPDMVDRYPHEFSGGQRQRIGVARALAVDPNVIICDEPTSALDVSVQAQIVNLLLDLQQEMGLTYLFISHDLSLVEHLAQRVAVMYLGQIVEQAPVESLFAAPQHPYTEALFSAKPEVDPDKRRDRIILPGDPPSPARPPQGCRFHPRCPRAFDRCPQEVPPLYDLGNGHVSKCFLREKEAVGVVESSSGADVAGVAV